MDIVRSAGKNVKIKEFFWTAAAGTGIDVSAAIRDTMTLFDISSAGTWQEGAPLSKLPADSILVAAEIVYQANQIEVRVTISYYTQESVIEALSDQECRPLPQENTKKDETEDITGLIRRLVRLTVLRLMRRLTGKNPGPWGILRGVRPTKIAHRLLDAGKDYSGITSRLVREYALEPAKAELVAGIAIHQRPIIATPTSFTGAKKVSIYIGVPYCPSRCLYCSFPAYVLPEQRGQLDAFLRAIAKDIESAAQLITKFDLSVESIYVGGGTPTSLPAEDLAYLLALINKHICQPQLKEFTVEAGRPDSINDEKIDVLSQYGISRLSINPQTMQDKTLKQIGRRHTVQDIIEVFAKIRHTGIPIINMDVIAGLPGETEDDIKDTMQQITALNPENITVHTLAIKRGSVLKESLTSGAMTGQALPNEQTTQAMLAIAAEYAAKMNMHPYYLYRQKYMTGNLENVGYAKPGADCLYNIQIMEERQTIIGIGPAAGTKAINPKHWRLQSCYNAKDVNAYIKNLDIYLSERGTLLSRLYGDREED